MVRLISALILLTNLSNLFAQGSELDLHNPDEHLIERLTFDAVNDLRFDKKISALSWDDILYRGAKDHAAYLIKEKKLSHEQRSKDKSTPLKRVKLHGGIAYKRIGENLVAVSLGLVINTKGIKLSTQSYGSAAMTMAQLWKSSKLHYRNILEKGFNTTAVAVAYDPALQRLIAVQVFGFTAEPVNAAAQPDHSEELLNMPERKLPFGLKEGGEFPKMNKRSVAAFMHLKSMNGMLMGSYRTGKKAFKGRRSGLAVESIPLAQFDSGAVDFTLVRNRRNGLYPLNGELSEPVYRREMLRFSRKNSPRRVILNLRIIKIRKRKKVFLYPTGAGPGTNLFLINKKRLITYVTPLGLPAELLNEPLPALKFHNSFSDVSRKENFKRETKYDTLTAKVFYPSRGVTIDTLTAQSIIKSIENIHGRVLSVEATAYASIDGEMTENHKLAEQRVNGFMSVIKPYLDTITVVPHVESQEQWKLFLQQIEQHKLLHVKKMHQREMRAYVNAHRTDSLISCLLAGQRFTLFKMVVKHDSLIALPSEDAVGHYYKQKKRFESLKTKTASQAAVLEKAQLRAYGQAITKNTTDSIDIVIDERYPAYQYHDLVFNYMIRGNISDNQFYKRLHELGQSKYLSGKLRTQLIYNNLVLTYKDYKTPDTPPRFMDISNLYCSRYRKSEFLVRQFKRLQCWRDENLFSEDYYILKEFPQLTSLGDNLGIQSFPSDSLARFYTTSMIKALFEPPLPKEIFTHVARVKQLFHANDNALSLDERVRLASFYCAFDKLGIAKSLLAPVIDDPRLDPEGRKLFITLQADAYQDQHEFIDYLINQYSILGRQQWCSIWTEGKYLSHLLLEDLKLKKFYNCHCPKQ